MKNKDRIVLKKILDYCGQCEDAMRMLELSFERFTSESVFHNSCCMCPSDRRVMQGDFR